MPDKMKRIQYIEADVRTPNGRIYPASLLQKMVKERQGDIEARQVFIYSDGNNPRLENLIGVMTDLEFDGKYMRAKWISVNSYPPTAINSIHASMVGNIKETPNGHIVSDAKIMYFLACVDSEREDA